MRTNWDDYFLNIAKAVSTRATCDRKLVGVVLVRDRIILSTGYNGSIVGAPHCDDIGHDIVNGHCVRTVHAEANAIAQAAKNGTNLQGAFAYCTTRPCWSCTKLLINSGITSVYFTDNYSPDPRTTLSSLEFIHRPERET